MELGALICTPKGPQCGVCPVAKQCVALREGRVAELPKASRRARTTARRFVALVAEDRGRFLVRQRPAGVVNAHLWEFPNVETGQDGADLGQTARTLLGFNPSSLAAAVHDQALDHPLSNHPGRPAGEGTLEAQRSIARRKVAHPQPVEPTSIRERPQTDS